MANASAVVIEIIRQFHAQTARKIGTMSHKANLFSGENTAIINYGGGSLLKDTYQAVGFTITYKPGIDLYDLSVCWMKKDGSRVTKTFEDMYADQLNGADLFASVKR